MQKSFHHPGLVVRNSEKEGRGLFAVASIKKGEVLVVTSGRIIETKDIQSLQYPLHAFQVEKNLLLAPWDEEQLDGIFLVNHSCSPNAGVSGKDSLVALRDIFAGEEICYDYAMTDSDPNGECTVEMQCRCKSLECRKLVSDLDWRNKKIQEKYSGYFSPYLHSRIFDHTL